MANSKLSLWVGYHNKNYHVIFSGLLLLLLATKTPELDNNWAYILPSIFWLAYSLYRAFGPTVNPGEKQNARGQF